MDESLIPAVREVVERLVDREFAILEADGRSGRLTASDLVRALDGYGRTLVRIPEEGWALADSYKLEGPPATFSIDLPLWTLEEGRSDLTLSISVSRVSENRVIATIEDIHVL